MADGQAERALELLEASIEELAEIEPERSMQLRVRAIVLVDGAGALAHLRDRIAPPADELAGRTPAERELLAHLARRRMDAGEPVQQVAPLIERVLNDPETAASDPLAYIGAVVTALQADRLDLADGLLRAAKESARARAAPSDYAFACALRSAVAYKRGALDEAVDESSSALEVASYPWIVAGASGSLVEALVERGELDEADAVAARAIPPGEVPDFRPFTPVLIARGRLRLAQDRPQEGLADLLEACRRLDRGGRSPGGLDARLAVALATRRTGDDAAALTGAHDCLERAEGWGTPRAIGNALSVLGQIEGGDAGLRRQEQGAALLSTSPGRLDEAHALARLGATLRRSNRRSDARVPLRRALELAHECHADALAAHAREELVMTGARPRHVERTGVDSLTPSERRIAELATGGASNPEIAQALFLSVKTIEMHLSHAYRKLDINSRHQLAAALGTRPEP